MLAENQHVSPALATIRATAEYLCHKTGKSDEESLRIHVEALCALFDAEEFSFDVFEKDYPGKFYANSPTHYLAGAAYMNYIPLVEELLASGCKSHEPSQVFGSPIRAAAVKGNNRIVELFLQIESTASHFKRAAAMRGAVEGCHMETLDLTLELRWGPLDTEPGYMNAYYIGALEDGLSGPSVAVFDRVASVSRLDANNFAKLSRARYLFLASEKGHTDVVRHLLLDLDTSPNGDYRREHENPLREASRGGHQETVKLLLESDADPKLGPSRDSIACAASAGYMEIVQMLLDHGANVNDVKRPFRDQDDKDERSPIVSAVLLEHTALFHLLRKHGAVLDTPDTGGWALTEAAALGLESMVVLLLSERVKVDKSAVNAAEKSGNKEIVRLLRQNYVEPPKPKRSCGCF